MEGCKAQLTNKCLLEWRSRQSGCNQEAQEGFRSAQAVFGKFPLCHQEERWYTGMLVAKLTVHE